MVKVHDVRAFEMIKAKIPQDAAEELLKTLVLEMELKPRMYLYVGPKLTSAVNLPNGETVVVKGKPTLMAHEWMDSFELGRKTAMNASVVYSGPPGYEDIVEEVFDWLIIVPTD